MGQKLSCICNEENRDEGKVNEFQITNGNEEQIGNLHENNDQAYEMKNEVFKSKVRNIQIKVKEENTNFTFETESGNLFDRIDENKKAILKKFSKKVEEKAHQSSDSDLVDLPIIYDKNRDLHYQGQWSADGKKEGLGLQIDSDGSIYYGNFSYNETTGFGLLIEEGKSYYVGNLIYGHAEGEGSLVVIFADGELKYEGQWKRSKKHGKGVQTFPDGSKYEGDFAENLISGTGVMTFADNSSYSGDFLKSVMHGKGVYRWADGRVYDGQFFYNKQNGIGKTIWPNENIYEGQYKNDQKVGKGTYYWSSGTYYTGNWLNNKQHGKGTMYLPDKIIEGIWRFGKLINIGKVYEKELSERKTNSESPTKQEEKSKPNRQEDAKMIDKLNQQVVEV